MNVKRIPTREPLRVISGTAAVVPVNDIDTDRIIPARYLSGTVRDGLGEALFADWRPDIARGDASILVAGANFGCGSSREHAVWALTAAGFRAVIAASFADIFAANAAKNGLATIPVDRWTADTLLGLQRPTLQINLDQQTLRMPDGATVTFVLEPFARHCLLNGIDELDFLMQHAGAITHHEQQETPTC